jgi:choline kinase
MMPEGEGGQEQQRQRQQALGSGFVISADGYIAELSKQVINGLGEAVGINFVSSSDKQALIKRLAGVDDQDYFERGIEVGIESDGLRFQAVDISDLYAVEVDFAEDLERANEHFKS